MSDNTLKNIRDFTKFCNNIGDSLYKKIDKEVLDKLVYIGEHVVDDAQKYIQKEWYDKYEPEYYERTGSLKSSIRYTITSKKTLKIYFDRRLFITREREKGEYWQPHVGFDDKKFVDGLINFIADGIPMRGSMKNPRYGDKIDYGRYVYLSDYIQDRVNVYVSEVVMPNVTAEIYKTLKRK